jgi:hypothetical protein
MFSSVGKKCFKLWCVLCAVQLGKSDKSICLHPIAHRMFGFLASQNAEKQVATILKNL